MAYRHKLRQGHTVSASNTAWTCSAANGSRASCASLSDGQLRYSELRNEMADVTDAALAIALKDLAGSGLIERRQYEEIPPRVEYLLTDKGRSVIPVLPTHLPVVGPVLQGGTRVARTCACPGASGATTGVEDGLDGVCFAPSGLIVKVNLLR